MEIQLEKYHLKSSSFFDFLSAQDAKQIKKSLTRKEYAKGDTLFEEDSFPLGVYIIRKGKVKIFQLNQDGKQSIVYIYRKGDYFGYRPLLAGQQHPVSAIAMDNVVVSFISKDIFLNMIDKSGAFAKKLLINMAKEFSVWVNKITTFSQRGVKERVALSLLILNWIYRRDEHSEKTSTISINRDDFAGFVGTAKETLVRTLRHFKDEKIIATKGTKIQIINYSALLEMVNAIWNA